VTRCGKTSPPEEEEVEAGEVRRLLMPAMPVSEEVAAAAVAAAAATTTASRVGAGEAFIAGWGGRAETRRRGARGDKWRAGSEMGCRWGRRQRQRPPVGARPRPGARRRGQPGGRKVASAGWEARAGMHMHAFQPPRGIGIPCGRRDK